MKKFGFIALLLSLTVLFGAISASAASVIRGDVDGNNALDSNDAIYLLYHIYFPTKYSINQSGDMDGNKSVDSNDAIYLLYNIFFPTKYPLAADGINTGGTDSEGGNYGPFIPINH